MGNSFQWLNLVVMAIVLLIAAIRMCNEPKDDDIDASKQKSKKPTDLPRQEQEYRLDDKVRMIGVP